jgi:hypothetical protein
MTDHLTPPRPNLVLRLGVCGHRGARLEGTNTVAIRAAIVALLNAIQSESAALHSAHARVFSKVQPTLRLLSCLADGADTLAAEAALSVGAGINACLPFTREIYRADFATTDDLTRYDALLDATAALFELDGDRTAADRAYEAASMMMLRQSDLLIAVWDGEPGRGRGGTFETLRAALTREQPVIWVKPDDPTPRWIAGSSDASLMDAVEVVAAAQSLMPEDLTRLLAGIYAPPSAEPSHGAKGHHAGPVVSEGEKLATFYAETERGRFIVPAYRFLLLAVGAGPARSDRRAYALRAVDRWRDFLSHTHSYRDQLPDQCVDRLRHAFAWTDGLASRYGDQHRDAAVLNFTLAATAVFLSLVTVFDAEHRAKPFFVALELLVLGAIFLLTREGGRKRWHERWIDYRELSEHLRLTRILAMVGAAGSPAKARGTAVNRHDPAMSWTEWYAAALSREIPLPNAVVNAAYLTAVLTTLRHCELEDQIAYHARNAERMEAVESGLELIGHTLMAAVGLVGAAYIGRVWLLPLLFPHMGHLSEGLVLTVTFLAGLLPAVGAACLGIREHGEFRRRRDLSRLMVVRLTALRDRSPRLAQIPTLAATDAHVQASCRVMLAEVGDWSFILRSQPLSLPG